MMSILNRLKTHYLLMTALTAISTFVFYLFWKDRDAITFIADVAGYISIFLLVLSLVLGPINLLLKRKNPVSTYLRRDIGIFGGLLAVIHSVTGLFVHLRGKMWQYFLVETNHGYSINLENFGIANFTGAIAALLIILLIIISNDYSLRKLKAGRWKNLQRLSYLMFSLVLLHSILYSIALKHISYIFYLYIPVILAALIFQLIGIKLKLQKQIGLINKKNMKNKFILLAISGLLILSCNTKKSFHEVKTDNPDFYANIAFKSNEDLSSPKFKALKEKYQLDTIFHGETDELKRILLLRNWIRSVIKINDPGPHPGDGSCESILDYALKGNGYHCGHFMVVQNAVMNAYGYVTRCLGAGPGGQDGADGHHGINEIWLNSYHKWFLSDAKYNHHFEKNGIPLSALEIRDEYLKNKAADIIMVNGPNRTPVEFDKEYQTSKEHFARTYTWIEWDTYNDKYTAIADTNSARGILNMYYDDYSKNHTWLWDGKPHWAYNTKYMNLVADRKAIEWTPNTIASKVTITGNKATIKLTSNTPNFKTHQIKILQNGDPIAIGWKDVSDSTEVALQKDKTEIICRAINLAGIAGVEHKIIIAR